MEKKVYQIQISLKSFRPKIWRRILVPSDLLLSDFHKVIQTTMGWANSHLHQFIKDGHFYSERVPVDVFWVDINDDMNNVDYKNMSISDLLKNEKDRIIYEYDFEEEWEHIILLEKVLPFDKTKEYPVCTSGKMNCPPEDCGGFWGYTDLLNVLNNPDSERYGGYMEWLGGEFDPEYFDKEKISELLKKPDFGCIEAY